MDKELKGTELPKEAMSQPSGAKKPANDPRKMNSSISSEAGIPGEQSGKQYHEMLNDKMCNKLTK